MLGYKNGKKMKKRGREKRHQYYYSHKLHVINLQVAVVRESYQYGRETTALFFISANADQESVTL